MMIAAVFCVFLFGALLGGLFTQKIYRVRALKQAKIHDEAMSAAFSAIREAEAKKEEAQDKRVAAEMRLAVIPWKAVGGEEISTEELPTNFLDSFLIRNWHDIIKVPNSAATWGSSPRWSDLCAVNAWLKNMPELFYRLTGQRLTSLQLDWCAHEFVSRQSKYNPQCDGGISGQTSARQSFGTTREIPGIPQPVVPQSANAGNLVGVSTAEESANT